MNYEEKSKLYYAVFDAMSDPDAISVITQAMTAGQQHVISLLREQKANTETLALMAMTRKGTYSDAALLDVLQKIADTGCFSWSNTIEKLEAKLKEGE